MGLLKLLKFQKPSLGKLDWIRRRISFLLLSVESHSSNRDFEIGNAKETRKRERESSKINDKYLTNLGKWNRDRATRGTIHRRASQLGLCLFKEGKLLPTLYFWHFHHQFIITTAHLGIQNFFQTQMPTHSFSLRTSNYKMKNKIIKGTITWKALLLYW